MIINCNVWTGQRIKNKILGINAARVYGVDAARALERSRSDDLGWVRQAVLEFEQFGR